MQPDVMPSLAIIVPVLGRPAHAERLMRSVGTSAPVYAVCETEDDASAWRAAGARVLSVPDTVHTFAEKANYGHAHTDAQWTVFVGSDVVFLDGWENALREHITRHPEARVIGTNDLMGSPEAERAVHPAMHRQYIETQGASWDGPGKAFSEAYHHWYTDTEAYTVAVSRGVWSYASDVVIEHHHYRNGKATNDRTYRIADAHAEEDANTYTRRVAEYRTRIRVCVYAIAKDEEQHVTRWAKTALAEADHVLLVDTGSQDRTVERARALGVAVHTISVTPWRFDDARNAALALVPSDIDVCVSVDLDEWLEPGWGKTLREKWVSEGGCGRITLRFVDRPGGNTTLEYLVDRVHPRTNSRWVLPCHEAIVCADREIQPLHDITITHHPDASKDRASRDYPLLELSVRENPQDARTRYYYARQLHYMNEWESSRSEFLTYLGMHGATFGQERSEACRFMARMVWPQHKEAWLLRACYESPQRREPWAELFSFYRENGWTQEAAGAAARVRRITEKDADNSFHIEPWAWDDSTFS